MFLFLLLVSTSAFYVCTYQGLHYHTEDNVLPPIWHQINQKCDTVYQVKCEEPPINLIERPFMTAYQTNYGFYKAFSSHPIIHHYISCKIHPLRKILDM